METKVNLKKMEFNEEIKILDIIYQDEDLMNIYISYKNIRSRLVNSCYTALIEKDRKIIGFIMIVNNPKTDVNEIDMGILKEYRNQGYGTEALGILKDIIIQNGLDIEIEVNRQNISAITSLVYNGFSLVRQGQNYYYYSLSNNNKSKVKKYE